MISLFARLLDWPVSDMQTTFLNIFKILTACLATFTTIQKLKPETAKTLFFIDLLDTFISGNPKNNKIVFLNTHGSDTKANILLC